MNILGKSSILSLIIMTFALCTSCGDDEAEGWSTLEKATFITSCKTQLSESVCDCQFDAISSKWTSEQILDGEVLLTTEYLQIVADCAEF